MKRLLWSFFEVGETIVIALAAVFLVRSFMVQPFLVSGSSMEPNFSDGNYLLVDELTYRFREPERGEVVVFRHGGSRLSYYIKRVIGLPGERVLIDNEVVTVLDGDKRKVLEEPYVVQKGKAGSFDFTLEKGQYFVMGDNRDFSFDSRSWGPLQSADIIGIVRLRLWPVNEVMAFNPPIY